MITCITFAALEVLLLSVSPVFLDCFCPVSLVIVMANLNNGFVTVYSEILELQKRMESPF